MLVVDRIEGDIAVVEVDAKTFVDVPLENISGNVESGSVLRKVGENTYAADEEATADRSKRVQAKAHRLFR